MTPRNACVKLKSCLNFAPVARNCRRTLAFATSAASRNTTILALKNRSQRRRAIGSGEPVPPPPKVQVSGGDRFSQPAGSADRLHRGALTAVFVFLVPLPFPFFACW